MEIKVLLVEDEPGIRLLLSKIIEKNDGFKVIGECDCITDAVTLSGCRQLHCLQPFLLLD